VNVHRVEAYLHPRQAEKDADAVLSARGFALPAFPASRFRLFRLRASGFSGFALPAFPALGGHMDSHIGTRLREWRHALGLTQSGMADRVGVHIGVLKKYEQGLNVPGGEALAAIARTGVNMTWLLTGEGEMCPGPAPDLSSDQAVVPPERFARRWQHLMRLVEEMPPEQADALLDELFARARHEAELVELRQAVAELRTAARKGA
jgi:transcriptional regulator with XRE-family HTH domain